MTKYAPGELEKWQAFKRAEHTDWKRPRIRRLAMNVLALAGGRPEWVAKLAAALARDCLVYQTDTARIGREDLAPPDVAWERGVDDCDAKARLFVALCKAAGVTARIRDKWKKAEDGMWLSHVFAEARLDGAWQPVELTLQRARVGELPETVPVEKDTGRWLR